MTKSLIVLSLASIGLAACTHEPVAPAPAPVVVTPPPVVAVPQSGTVVVPPTAQTPPAQVVVIPQATAPLRAGFGRVESIMGIAPASAGGTVSADEARRFAVRMEDGTVQYVDSRAPNLKVGDRVEITRDGYIRSPV